MMPTDTPPAGDPPGDRPDAAAHADKPAPLRVTTFTLGPHQTNCYVLASGDRCWLIDAGFGAGAMSRHIREQGLTPEALVLTHAHVDHIGGVSEALAELDRPVPVWIHADEAQWLNEPELNLSAKMGVQTTAPGPDDTIADGQELTLGSTTWKVLHTPGHSPGSVTLYCAAADLAFVGDALFNGSTGRWDFPTSNEADLRRSVTEVLFKLPPQTHVLSGHGDPTTIGHERETNPVARDMWGWRPD